MYQTNIVANTQTILGESPIWSDARQSLLWVDTLQGTLLAFDPKTSAHTSYPTSAPLTFIAENPEKELIVGIGCQLTRFDQQSNWQLIGLAPHSREGYRLNDAKFDAKGRLWCGLMSEQLIENSGYLYSFDQNGCWRTIDTGFTLINGIDWSQDNKTMFVTDSIKRVIYAYDFDLSTGDVSHKRIFTQFSDTDGKPDGLVVDADGYVLSVLFDGSAIARISPNGDDIQFCSLPVKRPTSCCFSENGQVLYLTSARLGLTEQELIESPASGTLLKIDYQKLSEQLANKPLV
ncbi:SMP-30/gluconolactonase/LRE family protein [Providencia burhodogranariea]|uniref:Transcriptional regulator, IclR family protein n=1 Tax=Providencia burhodogranariea DSM 19968 TaxID=1141662 RepID=K8X3E2_9GAMM|nr:SMP-30/gluconolactonase/LRE family protein [Providencia burhodogranariea]EKT62965.1 transcriptional regulator, IclR family protein [Providencia burhodogranariea DSM 19968]